MKYKRILIKLSGEALKGDKGFGIDSDKLKFFAEEIINAKSKGVEIAVVVGGGNIFRGNDAVSIGVNHVTGDYMGMMATVINGLALKGMLENMNQNVRIFSGLNINHVTEPFLAEKAIRYLKSGEIVIFIAGVGLPFFTTDTTAILRAMECSCDAVFKGTQVSGIYNKDPQKYTDAELYQSISYDDFIKQGLSVLDIASVDLARSHHLPIIVFNIHEKRALDSILFDDNHDSYSIITKGEVK